MAESRADDIPRALERAWADIHWRHPEVPHVIVVMATMTERRHLRSGHLLSSGWSPGPHGLAELVVSERLVGLDGKTVLGALLHEAAHGLTVARGVDDLSGSDHRYHTVGYRSAAADLGLDCQRDKRMGWSVTEVPRPLAARYRGTIRRLAAAMTSDPKSHPGAGAAAEQWGDGPSSTAYALLMCPCGRRIRMSLGVLARGPVLCRICGDEFAPVV